MACKGKKKYLATLVTGAKIPCAFCQREVDDEITYGKLYAIGDIQCHYFCALLSCCLVQKGKETEGLFGFLYHDILAEVERSKKHKCSYCNKGGAGLGCCVSQCRKQFHLPCGREKNAVSLFFGNYRSYCQQHAPKQKIPDHIMERAKVRMKRARNALKELPANSEVASEPESVCVICYEAVEGFPTVQNFWPPCCARDAWFHRTCLERMALSAGMHYLKCPLCNDKDQFCDAVVSQGYYVPDRDAAWELEQNAFAELYERALACGAAPCRSRAGRAHQADSGPWDIKPCILCGTSGCHVGCLPGEGRFVCDVCKPAAPADIDTLAASIEAVVAAEQAAARRRRAARVMPARMSLRRTKPGGPSTSQNGLTYNMKTMETIEKDEKTDTANSRLDLNLKPPRRRLTDGTKEPTVLRNIENSLFSPVKLFEDSLKKKMERMAVDVDANNLILKVREKLRKPRPLSEKKRIVNTMLEGLINDMVKDGKEKMKPIEWCSPRKICDISKDDQFQVEDTTQTKNRLQELTKPPSEDVENLPKSPVTIKNVIISAENSSKSEIIKLEENSLESEMIKLEENSPGSEIKDEKVDVNDDSSNSTFILPSEFIADHNSDDSLPVFETPKKLTTVDIQKDSSLEISADNQIVNIDMLKIEHTPNSNLLKGLDIKSPVKKEKCAFKFNPNDKEVLQENNLNIDVESFKNQYLTEVDREFSCKFNHKHKKNIKANKKLRTPISFALDATVKKEEQKKNKLKRRLITKDGVAKKKIKLVNGEVVCKRENEFAELYPDDKKEHSDETVLLINAGKTEKRRKKIKKNKRNAVHESKIDVDVTIGSSRAVNRKKVSKKNKKSVRDNIHLKIRFKEKPFVLKITQRKERIKKEKIKKKKVKIEEFSEPKSLNTNVMKQYVLTYSENASPSKVIMKPVEDVTPLKKKKEKTQKTPDNLVQTSIQNFFKKVAS